MCTTVIVGRKVSKTGLVIVGHNEDSGGRSLSQQFWVPAQSTMPGAVITAEPGAAQVPDIARPKGYYWSNMLAPKPGSSFDQGFYGAGGVMICSNGGGSSFDADELSNEALGIEGGVGFLLRRITAERATSAREAVKLAARLIELYGYLGDARNYTFADKREAWVLNVVKGHHYVAKRVPDDRVMLISNMLAIRSVDLSDKENVMASADLIEYAIAKGRYRPAVEGDYSDFDFACAYQSDENRHDPMKSDRMRIGWEKIAGVLCTDELHYPELLAPTAPMGVEDVKSVLRLTNPATYAERGDGRADAFHVSARDISRSQTRESWVIEFTARHLTDTLWRCTGPQDTGVYIPWFPMAQAIPLGYQWSTYREARERQFDVPAEWLSLDFSRHYWTYAVLAELVNFHRGLFAGVHPVRDALEASFAERIDDVRAEASAVGASAARKLLAFATENMTSVAHRQYAQMLADFSDVRAEVLQSETVERSAATLEVVIYGGAGFDVRELDRSSVRWSLGFTGAKPSALNPAQPMAVRFEDVDGDGCDDLVLSFQSAALFEHMVDGVLYDTYIRGLCSHKRFVAMLPLRVLACEESTPRSKRGTRTRIPRPRTSKKSRTASR